DEGRDVQPGRRHELAGYGLVARRQADHAVQLRALDRHLDVGRDQVAGGQDVPAVLARAGDEVTRRGGAHLERQAARPAGGLRVRAPASRIACLSGPTMPSRWAKQLARSDELFTIAIFGLTMSSSLMPRESHW